MVDGAITGSGDDPACRVWRDPFGGPAFRGHDECILDCIFGERDVTEDPHQSRNCLTIRLPKDDLDIGPTPGETRYEPPICFM